MTAQPSEQPLEDVVELLSKLLDGTLTDAESLRLASRMETDPAARTLYYDHMALHAQLRWNVTAESGSEATMPAEAYVFDDSKTPPPIAAPVFGLLGNSASAFFGHCMEGPALAYLIAVAILGVALFVGSLIPVSQPTLMAVRPSSSRESVGNARLDSVGQVTAMVDCRWADRSPAAAQGAYVALGRKYALTSGLMEITYHTGARVILQGPCTYAVESDMGGYLWVGKLTARVEKRVRSTEYGVRSGGGQGVGDESSVQYSAFSIQHSSSTNPQSPIPNPSLSTLHSPLFTIRTPSATVTDLGTEFGVEVSTEGNTTSHVFQGVVEVRANEGSHATAGQPVRLTENETVRVEKQPGGTEMKTHRDAADGTGFVRTGQLAKMIQERTLKPQQRWQAYSQRLRRDPDLLAYYTFEGAEQGDVRRLPNVSVAGKALDGRIDGADWVDGRLPGKYALYFRGPGSGDRVVLPEQDRFNFSGSFTVAVWFKVERLDVWWQRLVCKGDMAWVFERNCEKNDFGFFTHSVVDKDSGYHVVTGRTDMADGRWHLGVVVYEAAGETANMRMYTDGCLSDETKTPAPLNRDDTPVCFGSAYEDAKDRTFSGWIDEVAIFTRSLSPDEVAEMFKAGNPVRSLQGKPGKDR